MSILYISSIVIIIITKTRTSGDMGTLHNMMIVALICIDLVVLTLGHGLSENKRNLRYALYSSLLGRYEMLKNPSIGYG